MKRGEERVRSGCWTVKKEESVELLKMVECGKTMLPQLGLLVGVVFIGVVLSSRSAFPEGKRSAGMMQIGADLDRAGVELSRESFAQRAEILARLDEYLLEADSEMDGDVIAYYRVRIDQVLDQVESEEVTSGVAIWKLYSSGFVIKTPLTILGVDICEGPNEDMFGKQEIPFRFTPEQRERLAGLVEYSFHTHHHYDHLSHPLVGQIAERGGKIFVTAQHRKLWKEEPFFDKLRLLDPEAEILEIGPLQVRVFHGHQGSDECNAYLITTDSQVNLWVKGDIFDGDEYAGFLERLKRDDAKIDLYLSTCWTKRGKNIVDETRRLFDPVFLPAHEWEFTHRSSGKPGKATQSYTEHCDLFSPGDGKAAILSWGDRMLFRRSSSQ
jgi:hypothetical protein